MVVHKVCAEVINHWEVRIAPLPTHAARTRHCVLMRKCVGVCSWRIQVGKHCPRMWQEQNSHMLFFPVPLHSDAAKKVYSDRCLIIFILTADCLILQSLFKLHCLHRAGLEAYVLNG